MRGFGLGWRVSALASLLWCVVGTASAMEVQPIMLSLSAKEPTGMLALTNAGAAPASAGLTTMTWPHFLHLTLTPRAPIFSSEMRYWA